MQTIRYIMTGPLFFELSSCIIGTVCELLALDQTIQEQQIDASVFVSADALGIHVSMVYILCHFAEKLSNQSFNVTRIIYYDLVWYNLSVERQKCMVLPICRSQESFKLTGYGIFDCSMEIFLKVTPFGCGFHNSKNVEVDQKNVQWNNNKKLNFSDNAIISFILHHNATTER